MSAYQVAEPVTLQYTWGMQSAPISKLDELNSSALRSYVMLSLSDHIIDITELNLPPFSNLNISNMTQCILELLYNG
jgi:hypothetical protein